MDFLWHSSVTSRNRYIHFYPYKSVPFYSTPAVTVMQRSTVYTQVFSFCSDHVSNFKTFSSFFGIFFVKR